MNFHFLVLMLAWMEATEPPRPLNHEFDQDTLDALSSLPQPPEDDECERRWD